MCQLIGHPEAGFLCRLQRGITKSLLSFINAMKGQWVLVLCSLADTNFIPLGVTGTSAFGTCHSKYDHLTCNLSITGTLWEMQAIPDLLHQKLLFNKAHREWVHGEVWESLACPNETGKSQNFVAKQTWISALLLTGWVTLGTSLNFSGPHLWKGRNNIRLNP
jgi:hypothetical protein